MQKPFTPEIPIPARPTFKEANPGYPPKMIWYWKERVKELAKYYGLNEKEVLKQKPEKTNYKKYYYILLQKLSAKK